MASLGPLGEVGEGVDHNANKWPQQNHPDEKKGRNKTWAECGIVWPLLSFGEAIALINYIQDGVCGA